MTRERAIEVLKAWDLNWSDSFTANEFEQAFDMAISALSEDKGDLISRQAVLKAIQKLNIPEDMCVFEIISHIEVAIATLPSVEKGKSCSTCKNSDDEFSGECYECIKGISDHYEPQESED